MIGTHFKPRRSKMADTQRTAANKDAATGSEFVLQRSLAATARLVWVHGFADATGQRIHHPMAPIWPLEMRCTLSFEEHGQQTALTLHKTTHHANATEQLTFDSSHASLQMGWGGTLLQLDAHLAKLPS
jgi:hypothetical protein